MRRRHVQLGLSIAAVLALAAVGPQAAWAEQSVTPGSSDAYYSPKADLPQANSPHSFRKFLSTDQEQYSEQSFVWGGSLIDDDGTVNVLAVELQREDVAFGGFDIPVVAAGLLFNQGDGYRAGGAGGLPEVTLPVSFTRYPWSVRVTQPELLQQPEFVDARVVKGRIGQQGAIYELTGHVSNIAAGTAPTQIDVYARVKDVTGIMQWGYGPSGFAPMWVFPEQRATILDQFDGSVGDYLKTTKTSMYGQGQYYYTMPLLEVQDFKVREDGRTVSSGDSGWLWWDNVDRSYGPEAQQVISEDGGMGWLEFSVQLPGSKRALKIGYTDSKGPVGRLPYAMLIGPKSTKAQNGAYQSKMNWNMDDIHIRPVPQSKWTNPLTGNSYYLKWTVRLDASPGNKAARFTITQAVKDQEVSVSGRQVFEGLFRVTGRIGDGDTVSGWAFGEMQQAGKTG